MIMKQIDILDTVIISKRNDKQIVLSGNDNKMPLDSTNLAYRAAEKMIDYLKLDFGFDIFIDKRIPSGAGLAGGSSDAAGVINGIDLLLKSNIPLEKRMEIGLSLGADIPFFIFGGCVLSEGIGEKLTKLKEPPKMYFVVAKPEMNVSTKYVYENLDFTKKPKNLDIDKVVMGINNQDTKMIIDNMGNILENVTEKICDDVLVYKRDLTKLNADKALMSGSGSAVFGVFLDKNLAENAFCEFKKIN